MKLIKTILALGIALGFSAVYAKAQEGCDGPVFHPGSQTGTCACSLQMNGNTGSMGCGGPLVYYSDYYSCGGNTTLSCDTTISSVGSTTQCVMDFNSVAFEAANAAWDACLKTNQDCGPAPNPCDYTTCNPGTDSTPITASVYAGSDGTCPYAKNKYLQMKQAPAILALNK